MEAQPLLSPLLDWLIILLSVGLPGGVGGENDPQLLRIVPRDAVIALEWSGRDHKHSPDQRFDVFHADPEIRRATQALQQIADKLHPCSSPTEDPSLIGLRDRWPTVAYRFWKHPGCLYVAWEPDLGGKLIPRAAIVLNVGDRHAEVRREFQSVLPAWMIAADGESLIPNALWHFRSAGRYFIWTLGTESAARVETALQMPPEAAPANPALMEAVQRWDLPQPGHRLWINLPIEEWRERSPALWERSPLSAIAEFAPSWRSLSILGGDEGGLISRTTWVGRDGRPVAPWLTSLSATTLSMIPADAHYAASIGLAYPDVGTWLSGVAAHLPMLPPDAPTHWRERVETELGMDLTKDVAPAFGSTFTVYSAPSTGGAMGLSPVFSLDVRQPRQAYAAFTQAMTVLHRHAQQSPQQITFQDELFLDRALYTMQYRGVNGISVAPTFCITDRQLLMTLQPQTMRAHLRFLDQQGPSFARRKDKVLSADALGFVFIDAPALMQTLWPLVPMLANTSLNELRTTDLALDGGVIPSAAAVLPHIQPAWGMLRRTDNALVAEMRHPLSAMAPALTATALWGLMSSPVVSPPPSPLDGPAIDLGAPEGEVTLDGPASALEAMPQETGVTTIPTEVPPNPRRVWLSGLIRAVTPDDVEATLPQSIFDRIERGPSPEELQRREERRQERAAKRKRAPRPQ